MMIFGLVLPAKLRALLSNEPIITFEEKLYQHTTSNPSFPTSLLSMSLATPAETFFLARVTQLTALRARLSRPRQRAELEGISPPHCSSY